MMLAHWIGIAMVASYLLGSLPFGLWVVRIWKGIDIRTVGSGNIGATNVGRIAGPKAYALVFTLDVLKGLLPPLVCAHLRFDSRWQVLAGLLAIIGHNYSIFLKFSGGKGVATSLGVLIGVAPRVCLPLSGLFLVEWLTLRFISLGSLSCAVALPPCMGVFYPEDHYRMAFSLVASAMAIYRHRANIRRLLNGTEPKVRLPWMPKPDREAP